MAHAVGIKVVFSADDESVPGYKPSPAIVEFVSANYFAGVGARMISGRAFTDFDRENSPSVAIVNQTMADALWPGQNPIDQRFHFAGETVMHQVVGVVADFGHYAPTLPRSVAYVPLQQVYSPLVSITFRTQGQPTNMLPAARKAVMELDPQAAITRAATQQEIVKQETTARALVSTPLFASAFLCLVLAFAGVFGLTLYSIAQRTQELGIRMALGARRANVVRMILAQGLRLVVRGVVFGVMLAEVIARFAVRQLLPADLPLAPDIHVIEPATIVAASLIIFVVAVSASYIPATRATRVDPVTALRYD
jgi:ABC-type antimicrobial peptide transport system permease subunit